MRAVRGDHHVARRDVPVDDAAGMKRGGRVAELGHELARAPLTKAPPGRDELLEVLARHVVTDHDELVRHLVGCHDAREARAVALAEQGPHPAARELGGYALADERPRAVQGDQLGRPSRARRENALDAICVIYAHGMHDLLVVQPLYLALLVPLTIVEVIFSCVLIPQLAAEWKGAYFSGPVPSSVFSPRR